MSLLRRRLMQRQTGGIDLSLPYAWFRGRGNTPVSLVSYFNCIEKIILVDSGIELAGKSGVDYTFADEELHPVQYILKNLDSLSGIGYGWLGQNDDLEYVGDIFKDYYSQLQNIYYMYPFARCSNLKMVAENIFERLPQLTKFNECFNNCTNLENSPINSNGFYLWQLAGQPGYPTTITGKSCFTNCVKLPNYNDIPSTWK